MLCFKVVSWMRSFWKESDKMKPKRWVCERTFVALESLNPHGYMKSSQTWTINVCVYRSVSWCFKGIFLHHPSIALLSRILDRVSVSNVSKKVRGLERRQNFLSLSGRVHLKSALWWQDGEWHQMITAVVAGFSEKYTEERIFGASVGCRLWVQWLISGAT